MKPTLKPRSSFHDVRANRGPPTMLDGDWAVPKATGTTGRHLRGHRKWYDGRRGRDGLTRPGRGIPSVSESVDSGCYEGGPCGSSRSRVLSPIPGPKALQPYL